MAGNNSSVKAKGKSERSLSQLMKTTFIVGGSLVLLLSLGMILFTVVVSIGAGTTANEMFPLTRAAERAHEELVTTQLLIAEYMLGRRDDLDEAHVAMVKAKGAIVDVAKLAKTPTRRQGFQSILQQMDQYEEALGELGLSTSPGEREASYTELKRLYGTITEKSADITKGLWEELQGSNEIALTFVGGARIILVIILGVVAIFGLRTSKTMNSSVRSISRRVGNSSEEIRTKASNTAAAAEEMASSADQVTKAMEEVASSVEQVTVGSSQSAAASQDIAGIIGQIHHMVQDVAEGADRTLQTVQAFYQDVSMAGQAVDRGTLVAEATNQAMESAMAAEQGSTAGLQRLNNEITRVTEILSSIRAISSQTELLALNASIEAARAQEHGRGFAVVADEIKKLSVQTASSTEEISDIIDHINQVTQQILAELSQNLASSQAVIQQASSLRSTFEEIARGVRSLVGMMDNVVRTAQRQFDHTRKSSELSEKAMLSTEEIAAQVQQVSAAMQELSSTVEEVLAASEEMRANARSQADTSAELHVLADDVAGQMKRLV